MNEWPRFGLETACEYYFCVCFRVPLHLAGHCHAMDVTTAALCIFLRIDLELLRHPR